MANTDPQTRSLLRVRRAKNVADSPMTTAAAPRSQPEPPDRQIHIIVDDEQIRLRIEFWPPGECRFDRCTRTIHEILGLDQKAGLGVDLDLAHASLEPPIISPLTTESRGKKLDDPEADIVTRRRVLLARISKTDQ